MKYWITDDETGEDHECDVTVYPESIEVWHRDPMVRCMAQHQIETTPWLLKRIVELWEEQREQEAVCPYDYAEAY